MAFTGGRFGKRKPLISDGKTWEKGNHVECVARWKKEKKKEKVGTTRAGNLIRHELIFRFEALPAAFIHSLAEHVNQISNNRKYDSWNSAASVSTMSAFGPKRKFFFLTTFWKLCNWIEREKEKNEKQMTAK